MKYFFLRVVLSIIGVLLSLVVGGIDKAYLITGGIAVLFIGLSMIVSGLMVSGDRLRANFASESAGDRRERTSTTIRLALIGLPNMVVSLLLYFVFK